MSHMRGGAEAHADFKQYEYRANSSLVNSCPCEPKSLWTFIDLKSFGEIEEKTMEIELFSSKPIPSRHSKKRHLHYKPLFPQYFIQVVCDVWLGFETVLPVSFRHLVSPEKFPPPMVLLDVQPLPVAALRNPAYEALYQELKHFNPVQTSVFNVLYNSDDNVLVAAPMGSGKTTCSEFAILRNHQKGLSDSVMRAVYIAPREVLAKERYSDWKKKFGEGLGMRVVELTGETATDLKLLEEGQVVVSTPEKWDALSRRWKQRKHVQQVSLFIVDELHLIGGQGGAVLEVIVSRMRYIASQLEKKIRFVALSASVVNARDLGEWIGATSHGLFNFPVGPRAVPLGKHIQGADIPNLEAMLDRKKPIYTAIVQHVNSGKPAIVYVPSRELVQVTAVDLKTYLRLDSGERPMLLSQSANELEPFVESIKEPMLKETLNYGVGYLHEGLTKTDQDIVKMLFENGWARVCVMSSSMCCGVPLSAYLVVVMGTQHYNGRENAHTDSLEMTSPSSQPLLDNSGNGVILRPAPHKAYCNNFLFEAFPVESHLQHYLHDNLNAEVVSEAIQNMHDAVDYLTWTFMYKRLAQNPNYYNLQGASHSHLLRHLYELVKYKLRDLEASQCVLQ